MASDIVSAPLAPNNSASARAGSILAGGQTFSISQAPSSCTYSLATGAGLPAKGGQAQISVTAPSGCPWSTQLESPIETLVSGASGSGNGTVTVSLPANNSVGWLSPAVAIGPQTIFLSSPFPALDSKSARRPFPVLKRTRRDHPCGREAKMLRCGYAHHA